MSRISDLCTSLVDRLYERDGYVEVGLCEEVLGCDAPMLADIGVERIYLTDEMLLPGRKYSFLGQYRRAFRKIGSAAKKGEDRVTLKGRDLSQGEYSRLEALCRFDYLLSLQKDARTTGTDCLIRNMELSFEGA